MNRKLTRRQFGQIAIAGTTVAALGHLASKTLVQAQETPSTVIGVRLAATEPDSGATVGGNDTSDDIDNPIVIPPARALEFVNINVASGQTQLRKAPEVLIEPGEVVTGFTSLADGRLAVAITPNSSTKKTDSPTRLTLLSTSTSEEEVTVSGLEEQEVFGDIVGTADGRLLGLVTEKDGISPVKVGEINVDTSAVSKVDTTPILDVDTLKLPGNLRLSNLTQCPDGNFYATLVGKQGTTSLVRLAQNKAVSVAQLKIEGTVLNNGLLKLLCTPAGQLLAFGERRYQRPALFSVNPKTGTMTRLVDAPGVFSFTVPLADSTDS